MQGLKRHVLLGGTATGTDGGATDPNLRLNFIYGGYSVAETRYTFSQLIDFTRTSSATYVDSAGKIVPTPASRNLLTFTQEFDNAAWSKSNSTITANSTAAPDGTMTADTLVEDAATATHLMSQTQTLSATPYTASVYLKAKERGFALFSQGTVNGISVNLSTGAVASAVGSPTNIASTNAGNGWWRVSFTFTPSAGSTSLNVYASTDGVWANRSYAGSTSSGIFVWGTQLELGSTLTTYTRNFGGVYPPRFDYDPVTLAPRGLLIEEQRTNLLLRSEEFTNAAWNQTLCTVAGNAATSPAGTTTAGKLIPNNSASLASAYISQAISKTASATTYTASFFAKAAGFNRLIILVNDTATSANRAQVTISLVDGSIATAAAAFGTFTAASASVQSCGNGFYRALLTFTSSTETSITARAYASDSVATTGDGTNGIFAWGAQLEAGAFATSYIPTVASQVTRTADVATMTGANFSQWYNQSEGTFVVQAMQPAATGYNARALSANNGTVGESIQLSITSAGTQGYAEVRDDSVAVMASVNGTVSVGSAFKIALGYKLNDCAVSTNGAAVTSDTSVTLPTVDRLSIGTHAGGVSPLNGHIRSLTYYNTRQPNAQLQALTS